MKQPEKQTKTARRGFLKGAVAAGGAAAAAAATGAVAAEVEPEAPVKGKSSGYQLTEHVRDYYEKARI